MVTSQEPLGPCGVLWSQMGKCATHQWGALTQAVLSMPQGGGLDMPRGDGLNIPGGDRLHSIPLMRQYWQRCAVRNAASRPKLKGIRCMP
jgi:hypothetical protein